MLHTVPLALGGGASHTPVTWLQALRRVSHSLRGGQVTPTHMSVWGVGGAHFTGVVVQASQAVAMLHGI